MGALVTLFAFTGLAVAYENLKGRALEEAEVASEDAVVAAREAARASSVKSEFLANMSHEIRTPMNGIVGALELLRRPTPGTDPAENVEIAHRSALALLDLLNDIVDVSKIEADKLQIERVPTDLHGTLRDVASVMQPLADERHLSLKLDIADGVPRYVETDPLRLRQVVTNLVSNAIKFTRTGSVRLRAELCREEPGSFAVEVVDTGVGIAEESIERVFENFAQADSSTTREFGGTGLGLSISRRLARLMGGDLTATSRLGVGSTFRLTPPLVPVEEVLAQRTPALRPGPEGLRVLVVDDNEINRLVAVRLLEKLGHTTETATDGAEALAAVRDAGPPFDLVVMDCQMPVMDGYDATREVRKLPAPRGETRILAVTGHAMQGDWDKCIAAGMDGYLSKPITVERCRVAIAEVMA